MEKQLEILKADYKKYYNRLYGLLKGRDEERIDLAYNLNFIIKLYENGERELADILLPISRPISEEMSTI